MGLTQYRNKREKVFQKFNGRCAYSGAILPEKWEIDHLTPVQRKVKGVDIVEKNKIENLMPTFKFLNMFKKNRDLEAWRNYLLGFHKRIGRGKVNGVDMRMRAKNTEKLLNVFNIKKDNPFSGVFYFEKIEKEKSGGSVQKVKYTFQDESIENIKGEIWQQLIRYKNYYAVSTKGRIKTALRVDSKGQPRKSVIKKSQISREGYVHTLLSADSVRRTIRVDFLVATTFVPNPLNLKYVHHKNGDRLDIRVENLYWSNKRVIKKTTKKYLVDDIINFE